MDKWLIIENIALFATMCFLIWLTSSSWWALLLLLMNYRKT
jgi:hypothetical protein